MEVTMSNVTTFRDRLALALAARKRTAYWLARTIGSNPQTVLNLLSVKAPADPHLSRASAIADALDVSLDWLAGRDEDSPENLDNPPLPVD
jgi:transcriptional regulator with XRE-family HTH domain